MQEANQKQNNQQKILANLTQQNNLASSLPENKQGKGEDLTQQHVNYSGGGALSSRIKKLAKILDKAIELRTGSENGFLGEFIKQNDRLSKLAEDISSQFVRSILKNAWVEEVGVGMPFFKKGHNIEEVGLILSGTVFIVDLPFQKMEEGLVFQKLINLSNGYAKELRKKPSEGVFIAASKSFRHQEQNQELDTLFEEYNSEREILEIGQFVGLQDRAQGDVFRHNYYGGVSELDGPLLLLKFREVNIMGWLEQASKDKIKELFSKIKSIPCFGVLEGEKLNQLISILALKKRRKGDFIYKQGEEVKSFFLLKEGQIRLCRQTHILEENPNSLYYDRQLLVQQGLQRQYLSPDKAEQATMSKLIKKSVLPYADLSRMYNFHPSSKPIDIGVLNPFCLFGEEEYLTRRPRDASAQCNSIEVQFYELDIGKLEQVVGPKLISSFRSQLKDSLNRKILYRQTQYASTLSLHNRTSMDYFYLDSDKEKSSPRKFRITKLNAQAETRIPPNKIKTTDDGQRALYTSLNFNKLMREESPKQQKSGNNFRYDDPAELNIMNITHTWKLMEHKVHQQMRTSRKISPRKPVINLKKPLIEAEYFYHVDKEKKRIERDYRKRVLSLGRSVQHSRNQSPTIKS